MLRLVPPPRVFHQLTIRVTVLTEKAPLQYDSLQDILDADVNGDCVMDYVERSHVELSEAECREVLQTMDADPACLGIEPLE